MKPYIIFCEHAVETLEYFSKSLAASFEKWGFEIFWMDFDRLGLSAWKLRQQMQESVLITFNFIGLSGEEELWELDDEGMPKISIWEKMGIRCFNIIVDHPIYYYKILRYPLPQMQAFCVDRDHTAYIKRFYPDIECAFLPLAGNTGTDPASAGGAPALEQWQKRPYSLVFTANYVPAANIEKQLNCLEPEYRDFYYEIIEAFMQQPEKDLLTLCEYYIRREIPDVSEPDLCEAMSTMTAVDLWLRSYYREKTVRILAEAGIPVYLFGKDWEKISCKRPENLILGHRVESKDCIQAAAQAKISLNTMPWFKDGAHDRIFTAMLQGAVSLTDDSVYLREQFPDTDREALVYYSLEELEGLPDLVYGLLREPGRAYAAAMRGRAQARRFHTWEQRAETLRRYL